MISDIIKGMLVFGVDACEKLTEALLGLEQKLIVVPHTLYWAKVEKVLYICTHTYTFGVSHTGTNFIQA